MTEYRWHEESPDEAYFQATLQLAQFKLIQNEMPSDEEGEDNPSLNERVIRLIKTEVKERHSAAVKKKVLFGLFKTVAVVQMAAILCATSAFALSSEFRNRVYQLILSSFPTHSEIGLVEQPVLDGNVESDPTRTPDYDLSWLPDQSFVCHERTSADVTFSVVYTSDDNRLVILDVYSPLMHVSINTEGMEMKPVAFAGIEFQQFSGDHKVILIWQDSGFFFVLETRGLSEAESILAALSVVQDDQDQ